MPRPTNPAPAAAAAPGPARAALGQIVHYRLTGRDADLINRARKDWRDSPSAAWGYQAHVGNTVQPGEVYPAIVVRTFDTAATAVNLQVFLDGNDQHWVTSASPGDEDGRWFWTRS